MNFKQVLNNYRSCELMFVELFWLIIVMQNMNITPSFDWKPDEYTRLWYKFNWDATDYSTYHQNWTYPNWTPTYDLTAWQDWAYNWWKPVRFWNLWSFDSSQTFSVMFRIKTTVDTWLFWLSNFWNWDRNNFDCALASWKITAIIYTWSLEMRPVWWDNLSDWNWHNIVIVKNWSTYTWYQDWEQKSTWSNGATIICYNSSQLGCHPNESSVSTSMRMDNFIVQLNALSSSYVSRYWNKMKHRYWIS